MIQSSFQNSHDNRMQVNPILYIKRFLSWFSANLLFFSVSQSCSKCPQLLFCTLVTSLPLLTTCASLVVDLRAVFVESPDLFACAAVF